MRQALKINFYYMPELSSGTIITFVSKYMNKEVNGCAARCVCMCNLFMSYDKEDK